MSTPWVIRLVLAILLLSVTAVIFLPWGPILGLDFQNLDAFHDCVSRDDPYSGSGVACGDYLGRDMYYPPLLYWSFAWTRLLSFEAGYALWVLATFVATAVALAVWVPSVRRDGLMLLFGALLLLQYPMLFAVERGNNDVVVLVLWSLSAWLLMRQHLGGAGFAAGLAVLFKLYPAFSVLVVLAGLLTAALASRALARRLLWYCAGGLAAVAVAGLPFLGQIATYARTTLPTTMTYEGELSIAAHAITFIAPGGVSWALSLPLLAVWAWASHRQLLRDPVLVLSGALAISTYFSNLSVDYNLITTYPFLVVLFTRATAARTNTVTVALLLLGLVAIVGHRAAFVIVDFEAGALLHIWLQWGWLMAGGIAVALSRISSGVERAGRGAAAAPQGLPDMATPDASEARPI